MSTDNTKKTGPRNTGSGNPTTMELSRQEKALLAILDGADPFVEGGSIEGGTEGTEGADRSDLEVLGLLAQSLVPMRPSVASKAALFQRLNLSSHLSSDAVSNGSPETVLPFRGAVSEVSNSSRATAFQPAAWIPWALAATVLMAVALAASSGFLFSELRQTRTLVAGLESELDENQLKNADTGEYQQVLFENQRLRQQFGMTTMPKTRVCSLSATAPEQPEAKGTIFLRPDEGRWMMAASHLAKCDRGRRYRLWFLGENGEVIGDEMLEHVNGDRPIETESGDLPRGTAAIMVTLEFPDQFGNQPAGERVLYGDRSVEIY